MSGKPSDAELEYPDREIPNGGQAACELTLRDWLAGKALGAISNFGVPLRQGEPEQIARAAYDIADALLVERQRRRYL